jgi:1,4-dihydroxy-2-naphthoate polyprenyltransferase
MAARPRTLPAAIAPVLVGSAAAWWAESDACVETTSAVGQTASAVVLCDPSFRWGAFVAALVGSIFIQVGTNLANDYSDAKRGADTEERLGPVRVTSSGLIAPRRVLYATWAAFGVAVAAGIYLTTVAGVVILIVGALSIAAGVLYTGGPRPYGYAGLGELFVFLFFGLVAVNGSYYVQLEELDWLAFGLSISVGLLATAILVVNNVRDIDTDRRAGKNTLAVRLGRNRARQLYVALVVAAFVVLPVTLTAADDLGPGGLAGGGPAWALLSLLAAPLAIRPTGAVLTRTDGPALNGALAGTGALLAAFSVLLSIGLLIAA